MKEPFSWGKPLNGDFFQEVRELTPSESHDRIVARIQYFHDYLKNQYNQLASIEDLNPNPEEILDKLINLHYEIFQDLIYDPEQDHD